jgi:hypothetical protein
MMSFQDAAVDCILNVLDEGYDAPDSQLIRESLQQYPAEQVEKFVKAWDKLTDMERIALQQVNFGDVVQREWLEKVVMNNREDEAFEALVVDVLRKEEQKACDLNNLRPVNEKEKAALKRFDSEFVRKLTQGIFKQSESTKDNDLST